jgi:hypothetical protein
MPHLEQLAVAHQAASQVIRQLHPFPVNSPSLLSVLEACSLTKIMINQLLVSVEPAMLTPWIGFQVMACRGCRGDLSQWGNEDHGDACSR